MGYYTLSAAAIQPDSLPADIAQRLPHYEHFLAVLIGRLAVDRRMAGQGYGRLLLADAVQRTLNSGVGVLALVVDPLNERAERFYAPFGFLPLTRSPRRLYLLLATARKLLPNT